MFLIDLSGIELTREEADAIVRIEHLVSDRPVPSQITAGEILREIARHAVRQHVQKCVQVYTASAEVRQRIKELHDAQR